MAARGAIGVQVAPAPQRRCRVLEREEQLDDVRLGGHRMQPELELGDDAEVAAAAAQPPEQVRVAGLVDVQPVAVGGDQLERRHVVARQPEPAREPAHPAAERQAADAGVGDIARGRGQPMLHRGAVERAEQRPALHPRASALGIDADAAHRRQVDHQAAVRDAQPEHAVPSGAHADLEVPLAAVADRLGDVVRARAAHDRPRPAVDHRVPHRPCLVVSGGAVFQEAAVRRSAHHRAALSRQPPPASARVAPDSVGEVRTAAIRSGAWHPGRRGACGRPGTSRTCSDRSTSTPCPDAPPSASVGVSSRRRTVRREGLCWSRRRRRRPRRLPTGRGLEHQGLVSTGERSPIARTVRSSSSESLPGRRRRKTSRSEP